MSLIWDAMSCGRTKGEDESPPERRRTNGDIKSLLRPGTRATGVLCTTAPSLQLSLPSRPRVRDFWIHFVPTTTTTTLSREILTLLRKFHRFFSFFLFLSFFQRHRSFLECNNSSKRVPKYFTNPKNRRIEMENIRGGILIFQSEE